MLDSSQAGVVLEQLVPIQNRQREVVELSLTEDLRQEIHPPGADAVRLHITLPGRRMGQSSS